MLKHCRLCHQNYIDYGSAEHVCYFTTAICAACQANYSKPFTEAHEEAERELVNKTKEQLSKIVIQAIRNEAQKETAREILEVVDKMIGTIETSKSPANSSVLHNLTAIIFSKYPSLDRKDSSKKQMTDQRVRGDDGGKETLCIHGIGHGDNLHTCDGCCITEA